MGLDQLLIKLSAQDAEDYIGEPVSQLQHALQAAALAEAAQADEPQILSALLHDVGHWCEPGAERMKHLGAMHHERLGQKFLDQLGLHPDVGALVGLHVDAKRYLAGSQSEYIAKLSAASAETLRLQGGPMNTDEQRAFESHVLHQKALQLRAWDEAAKDPDREVRPLGRYSAMLQRNRAEPLSEDQLKRWQNSGFLHIPGWFSPDEMSDVMQATASMQLWPESAGKWMKYFELEGSERQLCRIENFLQYQPLFHRISRGASTLHLLSQLMGEKAVLFKEKINFKLPGGQGFLAHQDAPAFTTFDQRFHITMMLSVDPTTVENGCLEIAETQRLTEFLSMKDDLTLSDDVISSLSWRPVETASGDLVLFDSYLPHRSAPNTSSASRRALYATYNLAADGDYRDAYFEKKRKSFPPDVERKAGVKYDEGVFNVGNPVSIDT
ncbi:MAG: phytanoyl-CoA dioxygenase family protein [Pseudomonadales bacterium]|nr:phytanoyl-CoA dioxygenase family protein [Pseudomonadales bacterium]MBO7007110.1 phytanoyl-CoA dioxygenase family protein [Pseudomonadales bacterium]